MGFLEEKIKSERISAFNFNVFYHLRHFRQLSLSLSLSSAASAVSTHVTLPSVMYLQLILRNRSVRASSSSEVDDTTLDWRRAANTGG